MAYKIVFLDIDGTTLNTKHVIPESTKEAVRLLRKNGIEVAIATGRSPYHSKGIADELGVDSMLNFNGAFGIFHNEVILRKPIPYEDLEKLYNLALTNNDSLTYLGEKKYFTNIDNHPNMVEALSSLSYVIPTSEPLYWKDDTIYQVHLNLVAGKEDVYEKNIETLDFVRWHPTSLDVMQKNTSKATGIKDYLELIGLKREESVAFGDGLNDKQMLQFVGMGVAMGNAHEELKPFANMITKHVDEDGIYYGLKKLGLI